MDSRIVGILVFSSLNGQVKFLKAINQNKKLYATESEKFASRCPFMLNGILLFSSQMSFFIVASIENMLPLRSVEFKFSLLGEI